MVTLCSLTHLHAGDMSQDPRLLRLLEIEIHDTTERWKAEALAKQERPVILDPNGEVANDDDPTEPTAVPCVVCGAESLGLCAEHAPDVCVVERGALRDFAGREVHLTTSEQVLIKGIDGELATVVRNSGNVHAEHTATMWAGTPCVYFTAERVSV